MKRQCMYCGTPITECFGYVLMRDVLPVLEAIAEGRDYTGPQPREICSTNFKCTEKWEEELRRERENEQAPTDSES